MQKPIWALIFVFMVGCDKNETPAIGGTAPIRTSQEKIEPAPEEGLLGPNLDAIAISGDWDSLKGVKLQKLSATHERWACAMGFGEQLTPNPELFSISRARDNHSAELVACGHVVPGTEDANMVSGARFALDPKPTESAKEALRFEKVNDWRIAPIAYAVQAAGPGLTFKMVARMVGKRVSLPNSCGDVRPAPDPALYLDSSAKIIKLARAHDKKNKPHKLGDPRASVDTLHALRLADRMQLAAVQRYYLSGDLEGFKVATSAQPSISDNYRICMAQMAWKLGFNEQAAAWAAWAIEHGRTRDSGHAESLLAYLAADNGDWKAAQEHATLAFEFRAKASQNAAVVSTALVTTVGIMIKHDLAAAKSIGQKVVKIEELPQGPMVALALAESPKLVGPDEASAIKWVAPDRAWAYPGALLVAARLSAPEKREHLLDALTPGPDLLAYYHARSRVAAWYGDKKSEARWAKMAAGFRTRLKSYKAAVSYSR